VGLGSSYSQYRAKTLDWADQAAGITAGDGDVQVRGLDAYLVGRFRLGRRIKPYVQAGRTWYRSEFFASPGWLIPGRRFVAYDTTGWLASAGLTVRVVKHLDLEAAYRHTWMDDVQARAYLKGNKYRGGAFPLANDALSFGAAFAF
jgi:opacity protein-like surface antigen